jgi:Cdc6-like AAA superfamily ATPase
MAQRVSGSQLNFFDMLNGAFTPNTSADWEFLKAAAQNLFRPKAPIDDDRLFSGRIKQIQDVLDVVYEDGGHAVIFGERGVGKTSLANIIEKRVAPVLSSVKAIKVSCSPDDSFFELWSNMFYDYEIGEESAAAHLKSSPSQYSVYRLVEALDSSKYHILIFDEFDRINRDDTKEQMADTIKHFSNNPANITILIVGVGDTLVDLFASHESIARCCAQIKMQRMSTAELKQIITDRIPRLNMTISARTREKMIRLSQGLPGYVHLLGQAAVRAALDSEILQINDDHLERAIEDALDKADHSTRIDYYKATASPMKDNKYKEALLACALAETNELGMFFAGDVRDPYSRVRGKKMGISNFSTHLGEFCGQDRGPALIRSGKRKRYQYRFVNPLLQPLTIMMGVRDRMITIDET